MKILTSILHMEILASIKLLLYFWLFIDHRNNALSPDNSLRNRQYTDLSISFLC